MYHHDCKRTPHAPENQITIIPDHTDPNKDLSVTEIMQQGSRVGLFDEAVVNQIVSGRIGPMPT